LIVHGSIGCGGTGNSQSANARSRQILRGEKNPGGALWLSTNLNETDVVSGGEDKLETAILEADKRYRPSAIIVLSSCVPGIIGDDIDSVAKRLQSQVSGVIVPVHCEGFKTKIMATAYDAIYHGIIRNLLNEEDDERLPVIENELETEAEKLRLSRTVNLMNVSSMTPSDEAELKRLLSALGLEVNIYPSYTNPKDFIKSTRAALSISSCPTHDDYFVKHLKEKYGIPYIIKHMPIGIKNTNLWLRDVAKFFGLEDVAERLIALENEQIEKAVAPFRKALAGKKAMLSAGEIRTFATAVWLSELGLEITAVRPYHYDEFGETEIGKLEGKNPNLTVNVATVHPFETVNLLERNKPDIFLGHNSDTVWAAKLGIPVLPIYGGANTYVGYAGAFDIARKVSRVLKNTSFSTNLQKNVRQPYYKSWFSQQPFSYISEGGIEVE
jgi:nitrogenase molybdenum-iron protein alpha chain